MQQVVQVLLLMSQQLKVIVGQMLQMTVSSRYWLGERTHQSVAEVLHRVAFLVVGLKVVMLWLRLPESSLYSHHRLTVVEMLEPMLDEAADAETAAAAFAAAAALVFQLPLVHGRLQEVY